MSHELANHEPVHNQDHRLPHLPTEVHKYYTHQSPVAQIYHYYCHTMVGKTTHSPGAPYSAYGA